jgi:hypothetical protein
MDYKREYREIAPETKEKMKKAHTGKRLSYSHKLHISQGMKKMWQNIPSRDSNTATPLGVDTTNNNNSIKQPSRHASEN